MKPSELPKKIVNHIQHLERMRQDFVANVSHELRTPLTVIHGYLEALLEQYSGLKKIFQQMHQQTIRIENLIGYEEELRSLFSNIIFNAIRYTPAKGNITIEWFIKNQQAHFSVTDTGIGIAPEHIPRLTERFYRVDPARSRASGGTGLGLAIAKHVLIHHQGTLEIKSCVGKGSVFLCVFTREFTIY